MRKTVRKRLRRIAARGVPGAARALPRAVDAVIADTQWDTGVEAALARNDVVEAVAAIQWDESATPVLQDQLVGSMTAMLWDSVKVNADSIGGVDVSVTDPRALKWIEAHGAALVVEISDGTRAALRQTLGDMLKGGMTPQQAAKEIRGHVGLHSKFAAAVENKRARLLAAGVPDARVSRQVAAYQKRLLRLRSLNIAQTEAQFAVNRGQHVAWQQAADQGLVDRATAKREWVTAGDDVVREEHVEMDGQQRGLDEPFIVPSTGEAFVSPPAGVNCRCTLEMATTGLG